MSPKRTGVKSHLGRTIPKNIIPFTPKATPEDAVTKRPEGTADGGTSETITVFHDPAADKKRLA